MGNGCDNLYITHYNVNLHYINIQLTLTTPRFINLWKMIYTKSYFNIIIFNLNVNNTTSLTLHPYFKNDPFTVENLQLSSAIAQNVSLNCLLRAEKGL